MIFNHEVKTTEKETPIKIRGREVKPLPEGYERLIERLIDDIHYLFAELGGPDDVLLKFELVWNEKKRIYIIKFRGIEAIHNSKYQLTFYY